VQRRTVERDLRRLPEFEAAGYRVIQLWEKDIRAVGAKVLLEGLLIL
jgi:G:T-mismatch repair DNA endonuclease (very short patch repair protein)